MDKMREEFEDWFYSEIDAGPVVEDLCWQAWQASRAALVVELPETCCRTLVFEQENTLEVGMEHGEYYEPDDIRAALDKAGVRYE